MATILSGKERGILKSLAKTRPVDLKVGKKGITPALLLELRRLLGSESLIKVRLAPEKNTRLEQVKQLEDELHVTLIAMVGKTASFSSTEQ
jgi:RNA-binding protein YhbY